MMGFLGRFLAPGAGPWDIDTMLSSLLYRRPQEKNLRCGAALVVLSATSLAVGTAWGNPIFARSSARDLAVGEALRAAAVGTMSPELNPSGVTLTNELTVQTDYAYFNDASGSSFRGAVCDSTTPIAGCFYYRYGLGDIGEDISHRAHVIGVSFAKKLGLFSVGILGKRTWYNSDIDDTDFKALSMDAGITIAPTPMLSIAGYAYNLAGSNNLLQREVGGGIALKPNEMITLAGDARWNVQDDSGEGTFGGGAEFFIPSSDKSAGFAIRGGGLHAQQEHTSYVTGGLGYSNLKMGLDVGMRKAISKDANSTGEDLQLMVSIRIFGPRLDGNEPPGT